MTEQRGSEVPAVGQQIITACAFIHTIIDGVPKVFLAKRASSKSFLPNVFELPGGHIEFGENIIEGLQREIFEEISLHIVVGDPFASFTYTNELKGSHSVEVIYFASLSEDQATITLNPDDHSEYGWFAEGELHLAAINGKDLDDDEFIAMRAGFRILKGDYHTGRVITGKLTSDMKHHS